jgi:hypothetical protein
MDRRLLFLIFLMAVVIAVSGYKRNKAQRNPVQQLQQKEEVPQRQWLAIYSGEDRHAREYALNQAVDRTKAVAMEDVATRIVSGKVKELSHQPSFLALSVGDRFRKTRTLYEEAWRAKSIMRNTRYKTPFQPTW